MAAIYCLGFAASSRNDCQLEEGRTLYHTGNIDDWSRRLSRFGLEMARTDIGEIADKEGRDQDDVGT